MTLSRAVRLASLLLLLSAGAFANACDLSRVQLRDEALGVLRSRFPSKTFEAMDDPEVIRSGIAELGLQNLRDRLCSSPPASPAERRDELLSYFDRMVPFRNDVSLAGQAIKLSDGQHAKGISVHSRTVLRYDIGRRFERFRAKVGFQQPDGKAGRAAIRVLGDGDKVLHEIPDARGDQPPADLDIPVAGVSRLTLEVDFGADQDVGDRVAWANARLIRAAAAPVR